MLEGDDEGGVDGEDNGPDELGPVETLGEADGELEGSADGSDEGS